MYIYTSFFFRIISLPFIAIPALRPIVQDLFTAQSQTRPDSAKDLDTQREVVVSMLLRVVHYPEVYPFEKDL